MRGRLAAPALAVIVVITLFYSFAADRSSAEEETNRLNDANAVSADFFRDKVVGVVLRDAGSDGSNSWFTDVRLVDIEGRSFLVGKMYIPEGKGFEKYAGFSGAEYGYAWEDVSRFRMMTEQQFAEYVKEWKKRSADSPDSDIEKY